jgi:plastocyanin
MKRKLLGAAAAACLVAAPSLAYSQNTPAGKVAAVDRPAPAWAPTTVTVTAGESVTFESKGNAQPHYLEFTGAKPDCDAGVATAFPRSPDWSGECRFDTPGDYPFRCPVHDTPPYATMRGTIHVVAPQPTPTDDPDATPTPGASATPASGGMTSPPPPVAQTQNQPKTLTVKLARNQTGSRVRGSVRVEQAGSKLEVVVRTKAARVGRWRATARAAGTRAFSVKLSAAARRTLARKKLKLSVSVALTPPGGKKLSRALTVRMHG